MNKFLYIIIFCSIFKLSAQQDTLRVMTYNVLNYGDGCQATNAALHNYLKTIVAYTKPDVLGLVKMNAFAYQTINGKTGSFADTIIKYALNPAVAENTYDYCTFTNLANDDKLSVLFYNKSKLGFISTTTLAANVSDFNLYKLYYKDRNLSSFKDTTFLYIVLNHTQSGTDATTRNQQEAQVLQSLTNRFYKLPNLLMMGDFNVHNSSETFYQNYVEATDTNFKFYDTPFAIDNGLSYPIDWDNNPAACAAYLTTSTRFSASIPNTCGTSGGAKSWYDHILVSPWIKNKDNYIAYVPKSYQTIGNDGKRLGISINDSTTNGKNTSAPSNVIEALFQLSNKYPVSLKLGIQSNSTGQSPVDPDKVVSVTGVALTQFNNESIKIVNPVNGHQLKIYFPTDFNGDKASIAISDQLGRVVSEKDMTLTNPLDIELSGIPAGVYHFQILTSKGLILKQKFIKN